MQKASSQARNASKVPFLELSTILESFVAQTCFGVSLMMKYHHLGIPTQEAKPGERYLAHLKMSVSGYKESPYKVEWMRFDDDCPLPELVKSVPHVAFQVDDLDKAIEGKKVLIEPNSPSEGIRVAFIEDNGAPVEFLEIAPGYEA